MRFNSLIIASALLATSASAADFGGVVLGGHADMTVLAKLGIDAGTPSHVEEGHYLGQKRFHLVDTNTAVDVNADGAVTKIFANFYSIEVESVRDMALRKWGKPSDAGADILPDGNLERVWIWNTRDGAEITLVSYDPSVPAGSMTRGSLTMIPQAAADARRGPVGNSL